MQYMSLFFLEKKVKERRRKGEGMKQELKQDCEICCENRLMLQRVLEEILAEGSQPGGLSRWAGFHVRTVRLPLSMCT